MNTQTTTLSKKALLERHGKSAPAGLMFYSSLTDVRADQGLRPYLHVITRAWDALKLDGVLCVNGLPTLYLTIRRERISPTKGANLQCLFWNQGVATVLVVVDPETVRIYSGMAKPVNSDFSLDREAALVETLSLADYAIRVESFLLQLATGHYYRNNPSFFSAEQTVDAYLLNNLRTLREKLVNSNSQLTVKTAHTFLARILFVCYLTDREIIDLSEYVEGQCSRGASLGNMLAGLGTAEAKRRVLHNLFGRLKEDFNGSMFGPATLAECRQLSADALLDLTDFLQGHDLGTGQHTLDFWAYDFRFIPVETISAIYEDFLKREDETEKRAKGAYYTPRFLAETVVDLALKDCDTLEGKRFLDPSCGSGIFLVTLFNRLAAAWSTRYPKFANDYDRKAEALKAILRDQICGIDKNLTACQISCFSLYLAFLDCFDPPGLKRYIRQSGKLPSLLKRRNPSADDAPTFPVVYEEDFLSPSGTLPRDFDFVVGNPPWRDRGAVKGLHHQFALKIPEHLRPLGTACLLLPSKTFLNDKTNQFQEKWLSQVTVEEVVQLADYSFILFKEAKCPCMIVRLRATEPSVADAVVQYVTPKVTRIDDREGVIPIAPADRKSIPLRQILAAAHKQAAPAVWKQYLWGTPRDIKFLDLLEQMPKLDEIAGAPGAGCRWTKGQGLQPYYPEKAAIDPRYPKGTQNPWRATDSFVRADKAFPDMFLFGNDCVSLGDHLDSLRASRDLLRRCPSAKLFSSPLVLISQGIGEESLPKVAYADFPVLFQDSLQSICGQKEDKEDEDLLLFLTVYLRSHLAKYYLFHTSANWGTERDKVQLAELLRIPFPLPGSEYAHKDAEKIVRRVASKMRALRKYIATHLQNAEDLLLLEEDGDDRRKRAAALQNELEPLIYRYFGLVEQEVLLVEDTVNVSIPSATPGDILKPIPSQAPIHRANIEPYSQGLVPYADTLRATLRDWAKQSGSKVEVAVTGGVHKSSGMVCLTVDLTTVPCPFKEEAPSDASIAAATKLAASASDRIGCLDYLRGVIVFHGSQIYIFKPDTLINWTRTAALNDAAEIYARIAHARHTLREANA